MDIPELAHLDNSYEFLKDPCFETFFEYSYRVHRNLVNVWEDCSARNPEFKWLYFDQYAHCLLKYGRSLQSLLIVLQFAERDGMIISRRERNVSIGFCGWVEIKVIKAVEFYRFLGGLHNGSHEKYIRSLFRQASLVPRKRGWVAAFNGDDYFIFSGKS
jgi:hypothetical protein